MNIIDLIMGRTMSREQEEREREQARLLDRQLREDVARLSTRADLAEMGKDKQDETLPTGPLGLNRGDYSTARTYGYDGWWKSNNNPSALARSLHRLRDVIDMQRLTPDLDW